MQIRKSENDEIIYYLSHFFSLSIMHNLRYHESLTHYLHDLQFHSK